ncbi:MAG TPA: GMC family oxidoreductase [Rhodocyclaceae bacterium]|nr:GMC family oxidoreductase [Rhodocyclaceae bacterium]
MSNPRHDPWREGIAAGWQHTDASTLSEDLAITTDVVIVGSGAGGGVTAEILANAGLQVLILEEGPLASTLDFNMRESEAYPQLYQETAGRKTADKAINILQGRCVGGSTTLNWTSSFRTPKPTLDFWQERFGLKELNEAAMAPWFTQMEARLSVAPSTLTPNPNNAVLARGAKQLGIETRAIPRNVKDCWNLGYCGMGCPTNAKQSMLVTTLPAAMTKGARLITRLRVQRLLCSGKQVTGIIGAALKPDGIVESGVRVTIKSRHVVLAAGAINTPALLMRSQAPDPHALVGKRTFLHPTLGSAAVFKEDIRGFEGAPQTVYSDHFMHQHAIDGPLGYKLEIPSIHPVLFSTTLFGFGAPHAALMREFPKVHAMLALTRDGFHPQSTGGVVRLRDDGSPLLDYPLNDVIWEAARRALTSMAEIQFAAGAERVVPVHESLTTFRSWDEAKRGLPDLELAPLVCRVVSAHVMGGCGMADAPERGVVDVDGRHFILENLSIHDGSVFPTSIGANPQLSIYGLIARNASHLVDRLK